ncbi:LytS/YhcK type 5TM receptor domain-containing protein [Extibacter muris]|uniref:LytS/YhcK type 5TM receptor domain-containing protein n=1 Tax=Extibacter muris TaxID=1796622 RepID=UPI001D05DAC3|nr:LytS/YhcK type 5TM receptor domain-containing protein [Extibacter muris]MCB6201997.1 histidine kinase [Extibacter muris]MCQ4663330.1 histidine kinase [Extibacter muris]MCQ4692630.1 histidine kinase [Extibacter muris]
MQSDNLIFQLILNIGLLVLVANLLSKLKIIQNIIQQERRSFKSQVLLALMFGGIIILSTYTSIDIGSYNLNTRVIGAMTSGILGGPIVGLYASLIGAVYVYFFSEPQMFAMASAFSTVLFGLLGGGFYPYFQRGKWKYRDLFLLACFAEFCDMIALLRLASPFADALNTVLEIAVPMIVLNSIGILIFISSFNNVFIQQDIESSRQLQQASELTQKCLPLLRHGISKGDNMHELASAILRETDWMGVMITDRTDILEWQQEGIEYQPDLTSIPRVGKYAMQTGGLSTMYNVPRSSSWYEWMKEYSMAAAPFVIKGKSVGCLIVWMKKRWVFRKSELELLQHLVTLGSFQIAMAELEHQEIMRQQAELKALQFQVNPHFLFNALNTISCVCRENAGRARELLVILANYFRYNLAGGADMVPMEEEINHVKDYLELEKGRFEDKLTVTYDVPEQMDIMIPTLILQPVVENAVKYGINREGKRIVNISVRESEEGYTVEISDKGKGFPAEVVEKLEEGGTVGNSIGLSNVYKRMKSTYGEDCGIHITSSGDGSCVQLCFKKGR